MQPVFVSTEQPVCAWACELNVLQTFVDRRDFSKRHVTLCHVIPDNTMPLIKNVLRGAGECWAILIYHLARHLLINVSPRRVHLWRRRHCDRPQTGSPHKQLVRLNSPRIFLLHAFTPLVSASGMGYDII